MSVYSAYFDSLSVEDKSNYRNKLTLTDGTVLPDPLALKDGWNSDISLLPDVGLPDIYNYLVNTPGEFTKESLKAYKSQEAYNFFHSEHVQDDFCYPIEGTEFCFMKSSVLPSQRQGQKQQMYEVWVSIHKSGWILSGNCSCVAGYLNLYSFRLRS